MSQDVEFTHAIFISRQEQYSATYNDSYLVFADLKKAFEQVSRVVLWLILRETKSRKVIC